MVDTYDPTTFALVREHCQDLEQTHAGRNKMYDDIERIYLMEWEGGKPTNQDAVVTISPQGRNQALGAIRLMIAADPIFSVPYDKTDEEAQRHSEHIEKAAAAMWYMAGRIRQNPIHYDAVTSAILFGEMHIGVTATQDLAEQARGGSKAAQLRAERAAEQTPFVFETYRPQTGYPEYDNLGMAAYYRKAQVKAGEVLDRWGKAALSRLDPQKRFDLIDYCDYWDNELHVTWIEGHDRPLMMQKHNLPCIPIAAQIIDGSMIHTKPEQQRQPLLYGLLKSGLWNRQNLELTLIYTLALAIGSNPMFIWETMNPEGELDIDYSTIGGRIKLQKGESYGPLAKQVIDPSLLTGYEIATNLTEESTIYKQTLGQSLGQGTPFSTVALLSQAGRLPLVSPQKRGGWGIGRAMEIAFEIIRDGGGSYKVQDRGKVLDVRAGDVPKGLIIDAKLDISLPQDDRQNALVAMQLSGGDDPLVSKRYARENYLGVGQSQDMEEEIYGERMERLMMEQMIAQQMQLMQQPVGGIAEQQQPVAPSMPGTRAGFGEAGMGLPGMPMAGPMMPAGEEEGLPPMAEMPPEEMA